MDLYSHGGRMFFWIFAVVGLLFLLPFFLISPHFSRGWANEWRGTAFAHRGLHDAAICENTLAAFEHACKVGVGIELDVQMTRDGEIVVFHDATLERLLGDSRTVAELTLAQLQEFVLPDGNRIPRFAEVLSLVNGRVPLLVEVKNGSHIGTLCRKILRHLRAYDGRYIVESFQPLVLLWLRVHARDVIRGQLVAAWEEYAKDYGGFLASVLSNLLCNVLARPDFVAYDQSGAARFGLRMQKVFFHTPMAVWTVKSEADFSAAVQKGEMPIFEGFLPENEVKT